MAYNRAERLAMRRRRVRRKVLGSAARPRLCVYRSLHHLYAQVISDDSGNTLVAASTLSPGVREALKSTRGKDAARAVGKAVAEKCLARGIKQVVFDRNGFLYHGNLKVLADAARETGLQL